MPTEHLRHVLHGFDARAHGPSAPGMKKILGDFDMGEGPESLEVFPKKIGPDRRQIQFKKFGKADRLFLRKVLGALENSPAAICQKILLSGRLEFGNLQAPNLIDGLSELLHDREAIENIQGLRGFLRDDLQIRMPHVAANEPELGGTFFSEHAEEPEKGLDLSFGPAPEKPPEPGIELIDHGEVLVSFENGDLVNSDLCHALERAVRKTIVDDHLDGSEDASPAGLEDGRNLVPGQASGPSGQKDLVGMRHLFFPVHPGNPFYLDSVPGTVDPAREEAENHSVAPQGEILRLPGASTGVVDRSFPAAHRTSGTTPLPGEDVHHKGGLLKPPFPETDLAEYEPLEVF